MSQLTDKWIDEHQAQLIESTRGVLRIPSVESEQTEPNSPFGAAVRAAEDYMIKISADEFGLTAVDNAGYYAYVDGGVEEGVEKEMLGIIAHLDVVPEGPKWPVDAFGAEIVDGNKIIARGAVDDKGPAVAALYALGAVMQCGYKFKRQVRLIFGLNEETGMRCIEKYNECERIPDISFTPDGSFPLANSEFGICHATFKKEYKSAIKFESGVAPNIVPPSATASVNGKEYKTEGVQCHASTPWEGENAAQKMIVLLSEEAGLAGEDKAVMDVLNKHLGKGCLGEGFGLAYQDQTGKQTLNLGIVKWDENGFEMILDLRCPNAVKEETVKEKLTAAFAECGAELAAFSFSNGYYLSEDSELVSKLMKVYQDRTGDTESKPITMGGGTYARELPNALSFGPEGIMDICTCHIPMEHITFEQLSMITKMTADAIIALACE